MPKKQSSVGSAIFQCRHFGDILQPSTWSIPIGVKRAKIEHFKGYRMVPKFIKIVEKWRRRASLKSADWTFTGRTYVKKSHYLKQTFLFLAWTMRHVGGLRPHLASGCACTESILRFFLTVSYSSLSSRFVSTRQGQGQYAPQDNDSRSQMNDCGHCGANQSPRKWFLHDSLPDAE